MWHHLNQRQAAGFSKSGYRRRQQFSSSSDIEKMEEVFGSSDPLSSDAWAGREVSPTGVFLVIEADFLLSSLLGGGSLSTPESIVLSFDATPVTSSDCDVGLDTVGDANDSSSARETSDSVYDSDIEQYDVNAGIEDDATDS